MRRTFQDLARVAELHDLVTRAVSGHATAAMLNRYSTASAAEVQRGLAKVIELTKARDVLESACASADLRVHRGVHAPGARGRHAFAPRAGAQPSVVQPGGPEIDTGRVDFRKPPRRTVQWNGMSPQATLRLGASKRQFAPSGW
jgi:hypothetical protein